LQKSTAETTDTPPPDVGGEETLDSDVCNNITDITATDTSTVNVGEQ